VCCVGSTSCSKLVVISIRSVVYIHRLTFRSNILINTRGGHTVEKCRAHENVETKVAHAFFHCRKMEQALQPSTNNAANMTTSLASLRIRIRDPVLFGPLDLGSALEKKSRSGMNIPDNFSVSLETVFWARNT
jgi:hypothetical protein